MIVVAGSFRLSPANRDAARAAMARVIQSSRAEHGCLAYAYAEDVLQPGLFRVNEVWTDRAALAAHFATRHMQVWQVERAELGMTEREVTAYDTSSAEAL